MTKSVDVRGLPCPQPVIKARKAMGESDVVIVIVDNDVSQKNVTRMAEKSGASVESEARADGIYLRITQEPGPTSDASSESEDDASGVPRVLVVPGELMGRGEHDELGHILVRGFFHTLGEVEPLPQTIIFFNSGVKLVVEGSPLIEDLQALTQEGVEILACGTCLDYYDLMDDIAVGTISNMYTIAEAMLRAGRLIYL